MQVYSTLASIFTVISFFVFVGIVCWAWSARRKPAFDAAALEPFALPDEEVRLHQSLRAGASPSASEGGHP